MAKRTGRKTRRCGRHLSKKKKKTPQFYRKLFAQNHYKRKPETIVPKHGDDFVRIDKSMSHGHVGMEIGLFIIYNNGYQNRVHENTFEFIQFKQLVVDIYKINRFYTVNKSRK